MCERDPHVLESTSIRGMWPAANVAVSGVRGRLGA